jgi:hypothetical protein
MRTQGMLKVTSSTLLFPLLWLPNTHIWGRSTCAAEDPTALKTSWSLLITDTTSKPRPVIFKLAVTEGRGSGEVQDTVAGGCVQLELEPDFHTGSQPLQCQLPILPQ